MMHMEDTSKINDKIIEKLKKFSKNDTELKFCEYLFNKEILWYDLEEPPFRRDFLLRIGHFFPYEDEEQ